MKPSADADTLNQPTAMIAALVSRLHELRGFENIEFTIFHTDSFDYSQVNPSAMEDAVTQLARIVDANPFPADLGLIGIPNSQGDALFLNCLLAHEIGEYAYARRGIQSTLAPNADTALQNQLGSTFTSRPVTVRSRIRQTILQWAKEIFCDTFAIRLVGPCYSFAYVELFDLTNLLTKEGTLIVGEDSKPQIESYRAYPSHPLRLKLQSELLRREGWWDVIKDMDSRQTALIGGLLQLDLQAFVDAEEAAGGDRAPFFKALLDVLPNVTAEVGRVTDGIDPRLHEYGYLRAPIAEYLGNGIVPSTLNVIDASNHLHQAHPTAITLLNAAYRFYLEGVEGLMSKIAGQSPASVLQRAAWMRRTEQWTAKALEDVALIRGADHES